MGTYRSADDQFRAVEAARSPEGRREEAQRQRDRRTRVIEAYGGRCGCCGEPNRAFLELDHVDNDGGDERRRKINAYTEAIRLDFPPKYQVLCTSCNIGRARNGGVCPHERGATRPTWPGADKHGPIPAIRFDMIPTAHVTASDEQIKIVDAMGLGDHDGR